LSCYDCDCERLFTNTKSKYEKKSEKQPEPMGGNANGSMYKHTLSLIQDRPQGSLAIINAIQILDNTANRRIPRAPSEENSRLFCRVVILMAIIVMGYLHGQQAVRLFVMRVADLRMRQVEKRQ
jgi:hypothetical protein